MLVAGTDHSVVPSAPVDVQPQPAVLITRQAHACGSQIALAEKASPPVAHTLLLARCGNRVSPATPANAKLRGPQREEL
jgi:hypothetical protein